MKSEDVSRVGDEDERVWRDEDEQGLEKQEGGRRCRSRVNSRRVNSGWSTVPRLLDSLRMWNGLIGQMALAIFIVANHVSMRMFIDFRAVSVVNLDIACPALVAILPYPIVIFRLGSSLLRTDVLKVINLFYS